MSAYFKDLSERNKEILHQEEPKEKKRFFKYETQSIYKSIDVDIPKGSYIMVLELEEYNFMDEHSDNVFKMRACAFMILSNYSEHNDDSLEKDLIIDKSESIANDFITKIKRDTFRAKNPLWPIKKFNLSKVSVKPVYNIYNSMCGARAIIPIDEPAGLIYDATKWN